MENISLLIDKKVVVKKNDGVIKYGTLKGYDALFLELEFVDGTPVHIPMAAIAVIEADRR